MAKTSGGNRSLTNGSREYSRRQKEVGEMRASGKYSSVKMSEKGGGYVAIEKSKFPHKPEEIEAAHFLADKGYKVILKDEGGDMKTPDGYIFSFTFEQRTPESAKGEKGFNKALEHAKVKRADVALVYDKYDLYTKDDAKSGVLRYERHNSHRFKRIIVVSARGNIHVHKHNE